MEKSKKTVELTGGSVGYYSVQILSPTNSSNPSYVAECNDIIEALGMSYAEGNAFKAIWRLCAAKNLSKIKKGNTEKYDAEKLLFFAKRILESYK